MNLEPRPPLSMRLQPGPMLILDSLAGLGYGLITWVGFTHTVGSVALGVVGAVLAAGAIGAARRHPVLAFMAALAVFFLSPAASQLGWVALAPMGYVLSRVAIACPVPIAMAILLASMSGAVATALPSWEHTGAVIPFVLVFSTTWAAGYAVGQRRRYTHELLAHHTHLAAAEIEHARRGVVEERMRIARELHDVIAHSISVITVQAGYGHLVSNDQPAAARSALGAIETTGRESMAELRQLLGVLRSDTPPGSDAPLALAPAPGLADLDRLVAHTAQAGVQIELVVTGTRISLPAGVDLSAYRIVQEALTNVVRHSGAAAARAWIDYRPGEVLLEVSDDGDGCLDDRISGRGHGLIGMRERAALCHGTFQAGPLPRGGFRVTARLPLVSVPV